MKVHYTSLYVLMFYFAKYSIKSTLNTGDRKSNMEPQELDFSY